MNKHLVAVLLGGILLAGCGVDVCARQDECARKAGTGFSISECRVEWRISAEKAQSKNCTDAFQKYESCFGGLTCDQLRNVLDIANLCGDSYRQYLTCMN